MNYRILLLLFIIIFSGQAIADGLLMPADEAYPKDFLKNRLTRVKVDIKGVIAQTSVYQEFVNEWNVKTDAVYSFPLPQGARAVRFIYWYEDVAYQAVLKVKEQAINPGTGEGGIVAEVNKYIGRNGIKIALKDIKPGTIQKIRLDYISLCNYLKGESVYRYPLNTERFVKHPLEHLEFDISVEASAGVIGVEYTDGYMVREQETDAIRKRFSLTRSKAYLNQDFVFRYKTLHSELSVDFFSTINDSTDGHFGLFLHPEDEVDQDSVLSKRLIFLLSTSGNMFGYKLSESINAIKICLENLAPDDMFNIVLDQRNIPMWQTKPVKADSDNVADAFEYLDAVGYGYSSMLQQALEASLSQIEDDHRTNAILCFAAGGSITDPGSIDQLNTLNTGIFPVGIGDELFYERLEMLAALNYGFVTYISDNESIEEKVLNLFDQISKPLMKDIVMEYGRADLHQIVPAKPVSTYAGSYFFMLGRYKNPGRSGLTIAGLSKNGTKFYDFELEFSESVQDKFIESLWAKEMIDALEREIEIYGEEESLKNEVIRLSLKYNIRCRYTAYIADYENEFTTIDQGISLLTVPESYILGNYPNPFNPVTRIMISIANSEVNLTPKLLKIYNSLGQLVFIVDLSNLGSGLHSVTFYGKNQFGQDLPSGTYFVVLQIGDHISSKRITLVR